MTSKSFTSLAETFWKKICACLLVLSRHQNLIDTDLSLPASLEQFLKAMWGAASRTALILALIKLNSQVVHFFLSQHVYVYSLLLKPPSHPTPYHTLGRHRAPSWAPCAVDSFPLASYFTHGSVYTSGLLSRFVLPSSSPALSTSPFSTFASIFCPANKFICTIFLDSKKCKLKPQWGTTSHWSEWPSSKKYTNNKFWKRCGEKGTVLYHMYWVHLRKIIQNPQRQHLEKMWKDGILSFQHYARMVALQLEPASQ